MPGDTKDLTGKVALVTGGSRGIGREVALALGARGADVAVTFREQREAAEETVQLLDGLGVRSAALQVDLTGTAQLDRLCEEFRRTSREWGFDRFDVLVNNAGMQGRLGTFETVTEDDLDAVYQTNYKSLFFLTQRLIGDMNDGGRIVNLGSSTVRAVYGPLVGYGPLKAAVESLTVYLASFLGPRGITVNAVAPGGLEGDFNAAEFAANEGAREFIVTNTAIGRIGVPGDVGHVVAFLCSPEAAFINGAVVPVTGGYAL